MDDKLILKLKDPKWYLENLTKIKSKSGGLVPFVLNEAQKDFFNELKRSNRVIINKSRQIGFSTAATGYIYHKAITTPGITCALVGYNSDLTRELLDKVKTLWRTTPEELRPTIEYNSKYEITFPKLESKILVLPSTENVGRGYTLNYCLLTEVAFWEKAEEKMVAIENSVPENGLIIVESTPCGVSGWYAQTWLSDTTAYTKKAYGWWWHYSQPEIELIKRRMNNPMKFAQEYSLELLASGRLVFDKTSIQEQRKNILNLGDKYKDNNGIEQVVTEWEELRMYKEPASNGMYVMGADSSEGVEGGDYATCVILDRSTGEEVAFYRGLVAPDKFGVMLNRWGRKFNNALNVVEINNHGLTVLTILKQLQYPTLYFRPSQFETMGTTYSDRLGWKTTKVTRPLMIDDFSQALRDQSIVIRSKELINELTTFIYNKNNVPIAQNGSHDDAIMASCMALQGFKILYSGELGQVDYNNYLPNNFSY